MGLLEDSSKVEKGAKGRRQGSLEVSVSGD
jgi:hypothetical protein